MIKMILLGTTHNGCVTQSIGTLRQLRNFGKALKYYAIYKACTVHGPFHNATDERYLVEFHNDPYWENRHAKDV